MIASKPSNIILMTCRPGVDQTGGCCKDAETAVASSCNHDDGHAVVSPLSHQRSVCRHLAPRRIRACIRQARWRHR